MTSSHLGAFCRAKRGDPEKPRRGGLWSACLVKMCAGMDLGASIHGAKGQVPSEAALADTGQVASFALIF